MIFAGQDHAQEPGAHFTGPTSEDAFLLLQETQPEPWLEHKHLHKWKKQTHAHTYTVHIYTHAHCTGSNMDQMVHCTQFEHRNKIRASGKFLMLGCLQTIDSQSNLYWWLTKQEDSQYIVPTYSCVTIILQVLSQTFKYGFSLSHF